MPMSWMSPLSKLQWMKAIKARQTEVKIDGRTFTLEYDRPEKGKVWIQAKHDFAPCGVYDIKKVLSGDWIS